MPVPQAGLGRAGGGAHRRPVTGNPPLGGALAENALPGAQGTRWGGSRFSRLCGLVSLSVQTRSRIIEWQGLEGTLKPIWFQPPCHEQGHLPPDQVAQSSIQPGLEHCKGGGSHSFSGQPVPVFHNPHGEEFLPSI